MGTATIGNKAGHSQEHGWRSARAERAQDGGRLLRDTDGSTPILDWFDRLPPEAVRKCLARLARLAKLGHELRRPEADYLEDGIDELRARHFGVNVRRYPST